MAVSVLLQVTAAISMGAVLIAPTHSVGPYRVATSPEPQWACLDKQGAPQPTFHVYRQAVIEPWGLDFEEVYERDNSAFAAARAFVQAIGEGAAIRALRRAEAQQGARRVPGWS